MAVPRDTLFWFDTAERAVVWESRVGRLERFGYQTLDEVRQRLRTFSGDPNLADPYLAAAADHGYGVAYTVERVRWVRASAPDDFRFQQLGWLRCGEHAEGWLALLLGGPDGAAAADLARFAEAAVATGQFSPTTEDHRGRARCARSWTVGSAGVPPG